MKVYTKNTFFKGTRAVDGKDVVFEDGVADVTKKQGKILIEEFGCSDKPFKVEPEESESAQDDQLKKLIEENTDLEKLSDKAKERLVAMAKDVATIGEKLGVDPETEIDGIVAAAENQHNLIEGLLETVKAVTDTLELDPEAPIEVIVDTINGLTSVGEPDTNEDRE